jgi:F-type H+-transporting ATPase subunit b
MSDYMGLTPTLITPEPVVAIEEHHTASSGGLPQFDPSSWPSQLFWLAICFAVLYLIFSRVTLPRISGIMDARRAKIEGDMKAAEMASAEAERIKEQFELSLRHAATDASATVKEADDAAKARLAAAVADFRMKYDAETAKTEARLAEATRTAMEGMNKVAAEVAAQAAEKIAGIPADHTQAESVVRSLNQKAKAA